MDAAYKQNLHLLNLIKVSELHSWSQKRALPYYSKFSQNMFLPSDSLLSLPFRRGPRKNPVLLHKFLSDHRMSKFGHLRPFHSIKRSKCPKFEVICKFWGYLCKFHECLLLMKLFEMVRKPKFCIMYAYSNQIEAKLSA